MSRLSIANSGPSSSWIFLPLDAALRFQHLSRVRRSSSLPSAGRLACSNRPSVMDPCGIDFIVPPRARVTDLMERLSRMNRAMSAKTKFIRLLETERDSLAANLKSAEDRNRMARRQIHLLRQRLSTRK
ncbi:unnamed protein product [Protopolystoma xenopodis]|uniref:Uncharacterized protein n=1 Tax=Protopolystoma xenopodis TaxID=117903 RepID=A0A448WD27_9PLAT|nr:unnamed protein product [Protopolystoma xenopodis]